MSSLRYVLVTVVAVAGAVSGAAQVVAPVHVVPVVAKNAGIGGSDWMTAMSISNVSDDSVDVTAAFLRENTTNVPPLVPLQTFALTAGQTLTVADVVGTWFPGQGNTKGTLVLLAEPSGGGEDEARIAAATRIFNNADPSATYGQGVISNLLGLMVAPGRLVLPGARSDAAVRSNVGVVNLSATATDFIITTFAATGAEVASVRQRVPAFSMTQWRLEQLGVSSMTTPGRVEVVIDPATVTWDPCELDPNNPDPETTAFLAYLSRIDQATSDAEFQPGQSDWQDYIDLCGGLPGMPVSWIRLSFGE